MIVRQVTLRNLRKLTVTISSSNPFVLGIILVLFILAIVFVG